MNEEVYITKVDSLIYLTMVVFNIGQTNLYKRVNLWTTKNYLNLFINSNVCLDIFGKSKSNISVFADWYENSIT